MNKKQVDSEERIALKAAVKRVLSTEDGIDVFRYLLRVTGFHLPTVSANMATGEVNVHSTIHDAALRGLWLRLRTLVDREQLIQIELPEHKPEPEPEPQEDTEDDE